ncbi:hypothetical protein GCM10027413_30650 [Conyzicola nivalis]|uniref:Gram-positive cocci surface proteins LPxTG domain-containing protein n=1 Tax=Conyzicola nivalis TaxID=1477021 RepID=A0A916SRG7_9MICO|nr:LPXTG cell wall anchor domain-containing protein [Conyzicola nivalis]GGB12712.1 hypothetical protein GCM10010979_28860 [Conyzicola nivalis]
MRALSPVRTATRSAAISRRVGVVVLATALVAAPLVAAVPASAAVADTITSVAFPTATLSGGQQTFGYFNGDPALTEVAGDGICSATYLDGAVLDSTYISPLSASLTYDFLVSEYQAAPGQTVSVGFYDQDSSREDGLDSCTAPALASTISASVVLGQPTPAPVETPYVEVPLTAPDLKLTRGVAVDQDIPFTTAGLDFTATGGSIGYGQQSGDEPAPGYVNPQEGLTVTILDEQIPGKAPRLHISGTPKYSNVIDTGFFVTDGTNTGIAALKIIIADKDGSVTPITIDAAKGAAVAGAKVALIASGLQPGSGWNATVRSTPIVVGSGVIDPSTMLSTTVALPSGLEPGLHSITLASTNVDGTPFSAVLYFAVSPTGTLLAVSAVRATALAALPQLAATGQDIAPSLFVAGGLLLAGAAFAGVTVIRRRRSV